MRVSARLKGGSEERLRGLPTGVCRDFWVCEIRIDICEKETYTFRSDWLQSESGSCIMKKLLFSIWMVVAGWLSAATWTDSTTGITWSYTLSAGRATIIGASNLPSNDLVFPDTVDSIPVAAIGYEAFEMYTLVSVKIPEGVTRIGESAFKDCRSLTSITLPKGLREIGKNAFSGCMRLGTFSLPESVERIGENAFMGCSALPTDGNGIRYESTERRLLLYVPYLISGDLTLPDDVWFIHSDALSGCYNLTGVTLSANLRAIGARAFYECSKLFELTIPEGVTHIGDGALAGCEGLKHITFSGPPPKVVTPFSDATYANAVTHATYQPKDATKWEHQIQAGKWDFLTFESNEVLLFTTILGGGTIQSTSDSPYAFPKGESVTLTAVPTEGYRFMGWSGDTVSTAPAITLTENDAAAFHLTALFLPEALLSAGGGSSGTLDSEAITATVNALLEAKVAAGDLVDTDGAKAAATAVITEKIEAQELLTQKQIDDLALETPVLDVRNGSATLSLSLQKSTDLSKDEWEALPVEAASAEEGKLRVTLTPDPDDASAFYKFVVP